MHMYHFYKNSNIILKNHKRRKGYKKQIKYFQYCFQYQNYTDLIVNKPQRIVGGLGGGRDHIKLNKKL